MRVIANTTVISNFASIGQLDVLRQLFSALAISTEVYDEIQDGLGEGYRFYEGIEQLVLPFAEEGWIHLIGMSHTEELRYFRELPSRLHRGEASSLAIARYRGWLLLTDDQAASTEATRLGIPVSGSIGCLVLAIEPRLCDLPRRQSDNDPRGVRTILEAFPDIRDRFLRNAEDSLGARLLLGNHGLEAREARDFARARMIHYLPGTAGTLAATHGDAFDVVEIIVPDHIASFVLQTFGRLATPRTYDLEKLRTLRDQTTTPRTERLRIQGDATLAGLLASTEAFPDRWSVIEVHQVQERLKAVRAVQTLRTEPDSDGQPAAPNLTVLVIGHTHHAHLVVDHTANLVLMDCGAWIESYQIDQEPKRPNRQLGAVCGADLRIYQFA